MFYLVKRRGNDYFAQVEHEDKMDAIAEAYRLAKKHPGERFFICAAESCVQATVSVYQIPVQRNENEQEINKEVVNED